MLASMILSGALLSAIPKGEWVHFLPEPSQAGTVFSDSLGAIFINGSARVYHAGRWDSVPSLKSTWINPSLFQSRHEFWTMRLDYGPQGERWNAPITSLVHFKNGVSVAYDTANSCLDGNMFTLLGRDRDGKVILDQRYFHGMGGPSKGVIRFDGNNCEPIEVGVAGEMGAVAYFQDSAGREYFGTRMISDVPVCGEIVRLDRGKLDTLARQTCVKEFLAIGRDVVAATGGSLLIFSGNSFRTISRFKGRKCPDIYDIHLDSKGVLWVATEGYDFFPVNVGLVAISGADTVIYNRDNSGFPSYFATSIAEDDQGNIWVSTNDKGVAVFARNRESLSIVRARTPARLRVFSRFLMAPGIDLLGRARRTGDLAPTGFPALRD